ncbi:MAG TPA: YifB family Mg chelatase-like AAA ATPase [Thermoclostridium sp.]|nr:YifB family Mg chelatase-like AAA ATPase [Thermoclostridium sp.]
MLSRANSCGLLGISGYMVCVETDISNGIPAFDIVGLGDVAVKEAKERVRAAIRNSGFEFPSRRITINLAPADLKKEGTSYDLPIAAGIIAAMGVISCDALLNCVLLGELSLDGSLRPVYGVLPKCIAAKEMGFKTIFTPPENAQEASVVKGIDVIAIKNLAELASHFKGDITLPPVESEMCTIEDYINEPDFADVKGQKHVKRALEVAAAGGHCVLMVGSPGCGKTMLARRMPSILPDMTFEEAIEVTKIHSVSGLLAPGSSLVRKRPFRDPHHTISAIALVGGGRIPKPGEISLAHLGVLFLDELPEFGNNTLEVLRQPLENGFVHISRINASITYPCNTMLIAAANPCKCGFYLDDTRECTCTPREVRNYLGRLSGPLLDRMDIQVDVPSLKYSELESETPGESSKIIRERVNKARDIQRRRLSGTGMYCNAQMSSPMVRKYCPLGKEESRVLKGAFTSLSLTARSHNRILKVARTIADIEGTENINVVHISEAIQYRMLDRDYFR